MSGIGPEADTAAHDFMGFDPSLPVGPAAYYLQYNCIVANPYPADKRKLVDDAGDRSTYS